MALGPFRRGDIAQRAADQERLRLDQTKRQLNGELAAVCPHARQLQSPSEHGPLAGLDEAGKGRAVAFAKRRRHDQLGHRPPERLIT